MWRGLRPSSLPVSLQHVSALCRFLFVRPSGHLGRRWRRGGSSRVRLEERGQQRAALAWGHEGCAPPKPEERPNGPARAGVPPQRHPAPSAGGRAVRASFEGCGSHAGSSQTEHVVCRRALCFVGPSVSLLCLHFSLAYV